MEFTAKDGWDWKLELPSFRGSWLGERREPRRLNG